MNDPKTKSSAQVVPPLGGSPSVPSVVKTEVPESPEVKSAREDAARRSRKEDLDEAAKILFTDVRNSIDQVAHYSINEHPEILRQQLGRLYDRLTRAHGLLSKHIDNLPTCSIVNLAKDAPTK